MSQNTLPPSGGVGLAEPPAVEAAEEASSGGNRRVLLFVVAGLLLVGGVAAWLLLFSGGGAEDESVALPVKKPAADAPADPAAAPAPEAVPAPPPTFNSTTGRDPFTPLVKTAEQAAAEAAKAAEAQAASASGSTAVDANGQPVGSGTTLSVVQVEDTGAWVTVTVDGVAFNTLPAGAPFGEFFQVYSIFAPTCAGFLYGDENVVVCEGKSVTLTK
jgi:flagellar basal body-associated protein FliL